MSSQPVKLPVPKLREVMQRLGKSQADVMRLTGWSEAKVSRVINGKRKGITMAELEHLAKSLGVSKAELADIEDVAQSDRERKLLEAFRSSNEAHRQLAETALKAAQ